MIEPKELQTRIEGALPGSRVTVRDMTGTRDHFEVVVISADFSGKTLIEQHRMIHSPLRDILGGALHAIDLKTMTPQEATERAGL